MSALWPRIAIVLALGLAPVTTALPAALTCESRDNGWHACTADTRGGVTLIRQLSRAGCWQGVTWGHDQNRIWVHRGCRAEFQTGATNARRLRGGRFGHAPVFGLLDHGNREHDDSRPEHHRGVDPRTQDSGSDTTGRGQTIGRNFSCASTGNHLTWCRQAVDRRNDVEIRRQLSRAPCTYGHSWGVDREDVWVNHGCRAEFVVY
jgi:hypothetical protein